MPDGLTLRHHLDLMGRERRPVARWILLGLLAAFLLLGLANLLGQRPATTLVASDSADLELYAPTKVRGGLVFMARFTVHARRELEKATLVLDPGWLEGMTLNTVEPAPVGEASRTGKLVFDLGRVRAGTKHVLFLHFQVNPTNVGHRSQDVELLDGEDALVHLDREVTVFP